MSKNNITEVMRINWKTLRQSTRQELFLQWEVRLKAFPMPRKAATHHYLNDKRTPRTLKGCGLYANCFSNQIWILPLPNTPIHCLDDLILLQGNMALHYGHLGKETNAEHTRVGLIVIIVHRGFPSWWECTNLIPTDTAFSKNADKQNLFFLHEM